MIECGIPDLLKKRLDNLIWLDSSLESLEWVEVYIKLEDLKELIDVAYKLWKACSNNN